MKPIGIIPDRLICDRWENGYYILYVDMMCNYGIPTPSIRTPINRTLLITDIM